MFQSLQDWGKAGDCILQFSVFDFKAAGFAPTKAVWPSSRRLRHCIMDILLYTQMSLLSQFLWGNDLMVWKFNHFLLTTLLPTIFQKWKIQYLWFSPLGGVRVSSSPLCFSNVTAIGRIRCRPESSECHRRPGQSTVSWRTSSILCHLHQPWPPPDLRAKQNLRCEWNEFLQATQWL